MGNKRSVIVASCLLAVAVIAMLVVLAKREMPQETVGALRPPTVPATEEAKDENKSIEVIDSLKQRISLLEEKVETLSKVIEKNNEDNSLSWRAASLAEMQKELRQLECNIGTGFTAERRYTYPIFNALGFDPDDYGKGIKNPLLAETKYQEHCPGR